MEIKKALVIDDENIVLDSIKRILTQDAFEVDVCKNSRQGLDYGLTRQYDIVLTDIRMPEISGMRILRDLKRFKPSMPVIIITGFATVKSAVQAMKLGATDYIEKPFTPEELISAVHNTLEVASKEEPEEQKIIHHEEVLSVLNRIIDDKDFVEDISIHGADALEEYNLTGPEKLAILTGDIAWIEQHVGKLNDKQKRWLNERLSAEIW